MAGGKGLLADFQLAAGLDPSSGCPLPWGKHWSGPSSILATSIPTRSRDTFRSGSGGRGDVDLAQSARGGLVRGVDGVGTCVHIQGRSSKLLRSADGRRDFLKHFVPVDVCRGGGVRMSASPSTRKGIVTRTCCTG